MLHLLLTSGNCQQQTYYRRTKMEMISGKNIAKSAGSATVAGGVAVGSVAAAYSMYKTLVYRRY